MAKRRKKKKKGEPFAGWPVVAGVAVLCAAVLLLLSLASYHPNDTDGQYPPNDPVQNLCGFVGAWAAWGLYHAFGLSGFMVALVLLGWGVALVVSRTPAHLWLRIAGTLFFVSSLAALDNLTDFSALGLPTADSFGIQRGGQVGSYMGDALKPMFGLTGSLVFFCAAVVLSAVLAADRVVFTLCGWSYAGCVWVMGWLWETGAQWRERLGEWGEERAERRALAREARQAARAEAEEAEYEDEEEYEEEEYEEEEEEEPVPVAVKSKPKTKAKKAKPRLAPPPPMRQPVVKPMSPGFDPTSYALPPISILEDPRPFDAGNLEQQIERNSVVLEKTLTEFNIEARVVKTERGPVVTLYALELAPGIKGTRVMSLNDDLKRALKSTSLRIVAPIPGTQYVGVEIPNGKKERVCLKEILGSPKVDASRYMLPIVLGKDASGRPLVEDLADMPHLLIAGTTGSGKSVCVNAIILSLLLLRYPSDVKLLLVDPKAVELAPYRDIPHLMHPVITDMKKAPHVLEWAVKKMEDRYQQLLATHSKSISEYNALGKKKIDAYLEEAGGEPGSLPYHMPYVVIVIDEFADLMMQARKDVESHVNRLAAKSRAIGIHMIMATQRPSSEVVTGLIKSNIAARIAFRVVGKVNSRVILDVNGAEELQGQGDMLYRVPRTSDLLRAQGSFVSDYEIAEVTKFIKEQAKPEYSQELQQWGGGGIDEADKDDLYDQAARFVVDAQRGSVSLLQRQFNVGYTRASRIMEQLTLGGVVGQFKGSKAREVLLTADQYEQMKGQETHDD